MNKNARIYVAALAACCFLAACGGKEERAKTHLEKGRTLFAEAEYDKAGVEIRNVLQIEPRSADAYHLSAQIWERRNEFQKAFAAYAKAVELAPDHLAAKARMGRYYLFGGAREKARQTADEILAADPGNPDGLTLSAALLAEKDPKAAAAEARAVLEAHPGHADASALLASLLARGQDRDAAAKVLSGAVERNPADAGLRLALASLFEQEKRYPEAEAQLRKLVEQTPKRLEYRSALAGLLVRAKQPDKAEAVLREAAKADVGDDRHVIALVEYIAATRDFNAAERELRGFIEARPRAYDLRFALAGMYLNARRADDAIGVYREVIAADKAGAKGIQARGALARTLAAENRPEEAAALIAEVLKENPRDNTALMLRAQQSLQRGDNLAAIADLRAVLRDQPDSVELTSLLARAHLANKEPELAREVLGRAVQLYPRQAAFRYLYASFLVRQGEQAQALSVVEEQLKAQPGDALALQTKAEIQASAKDLAGAEATLKALVKAQPDSPLGYYRLAQLYVAQKKNPAALAELERAAAKAPRDPEVLSALVKLMLSEKKLEQAGARLKKAVAAHPDEPLLHVMLGEFLAAQHKLAEAAPAFRRALELRPQLEAARTNLARLHLAQNDSEGAEALLQQGLELAPRSVPLRLLLAEARQRRGDFTGAIAQYEAVLKFAPGHDVAANNFAALVADHAAERKSLERALVVARRFERSPNPLYLDTLGWLHYRLGDNAQAVQVLTKAVAQADAPVLHYHLGMALHRAGRAADAQSHLKKASDAPVEFPGRAEARALLAKG